LRLPNAEAAIVDIQKLRGYCLSPIHAEGKHKARVFFSALGMTAKDAEELRNMLKQAAVSNDASDGGTDEFGVRYILDFAAQRRGRSARIRSCWIIRSQELNPRLVTCYIL
jgi:hypothetical protein